MSFFNKLRGDMGLEEKKEVPKEKAKAKKKAKVEVAKNPEPKPEPKKAATEGGEPRPEKSGREFKPLKLEQDDSSSKEEGQLAIDVYETEDDIVVQSTIGGIKAEDLDISIEDDMVTIRGSRENKIEKEGKKYFYQECYWGAFMRKLILPEEVDASKSKAVIKEGILTLSMPKIHRKTKKKITVEREE